MQMTKAFEQGYLSFVIHPLIVCTELHDCVTVCVYVYEWSLSASNSTTDLPMCMCDCAADGTRPTWNDRRLYNSIRFDDNKLKIERQGEESEMEREREHRLNATIGINFLNKHCLKNVNTNAKICKSIWSTHELWNTLVQWFLFVIDHEQTIYIYSICWFAMK